MINESQLLSLITAGENNSVDFKRELDLDTAQGKAELVKDIISIANSVQNVGHILVGIDDNRTIIGVKSIEEERLQQVAYTYITPAVSLAYSAISLQSPVLTQVGIIEIRPAVKPHKVVRSLEKIEQNQVFIRHGSVVMKASPEEIIRMHTESRLVIESRQYVEAAAKHWKLGNMRNVLNSYSKAIELLPTSSLLIARARTYSKLYEWESALADYEGAIRISDSPQMEKIARYERVVILSDHSTRYMTDEWDNDLAWLKANLQGTELGHVLYLEAHRLREDHFLFENYETYAIEILSEVIQLGYIRPKVYVYRSEAYYNQHNYGLAIEDLNKAIDLFEKNEAKASEYVEYLEFMGHALCMTRQYIKAQACFEKARSLLGGQNEGTWGAWSGSDGIAEQILCMCALDYKYGYTTLRPGEMQLLEQIVQYFRNWHEHVQSKYPSVASIFQNMTNKKVG